MALPATIDTSLSIPGWKNVYRGPYEVGGNLYVVGTNATSATAEIWKSTDGGHTWAEQDSADSPVAGALGISSCLDGTIIAVARVTAGGVWIYRFETSTDQWLTHTTGGTSNAANDVTGNINCAIACRGANDYVVAFNRTGEAIMGTTYRRVGIITRVAGTWGTATNIETGVQSHQDLVHVVLGSSSRVHIIYRASTSTALRHCAFLSGGTFTTPANILTGVNTGFYAHGIPTRYIDGANTKIVLPYAQSGGDGAVIRFTSADSPTFSFETTTTANDPLVTDTSAGTAAADGTTIYCFWMDNAGWDIYRNNDAGTGTWGTDTLHRTVGNAHVLNVSKITGAIGITYEDTGVIKYDALTLTAPPAATANRFKMVV